MNIQLDRATSRFLEKATAQKRNPEGGLVSLEEVVGEKDEENLPAQLKQYFIEHPAQHTSEEEEMYRAIELAISRLAKRNPKLAYIIRQRYQFGKTQQEIGEEYDSRRQNIEQLEKKALAIIRKIISGEIKDNSSIPSDRFMKKFKKPYQFEEY